MEELVVALGQRGLTMVGLADRIRATVEDRAQFTPVMRFILVDEERRAFRAERWCYLGSIDDWIDMGPLGPLDRLARQLIPKLGTDQFFELF